MKEEAGGAADGQTNRATRARQRGSVGERAAEADRVRD